jgi:hypothetical protein
MICDKDHHQASVKLGEAEPPSSQRVAFRHVCAGCAYDLGFQDGRAAVLGYKVTEKKKPEGGCSCATMDGGKTCAHCLGEMEAALEKAD